MIFAKGKIFRCFHHLHQNRLPGRIQSITVGKYATTSEGVKIHLRKIKEFIASYESRSAATAMLDQIESRSGVSAGCNLCWMHAIIHVYMREDVKLSQRTDAIDFLLVVMNVIPAP